MQKHRYIFTCIKKGCQDILYNKRYKAMSLMELMVVLAIIGILLLLAVPKLMPLITKTKATEAQMQLNHLHMLEQTYFYTHSKYTADFDQLDYEHEKLITEGGNANYKIEIIKADVNGFKARATAIVDFDNDGQYNIWEIDENKNLVEIQKD
tara:strand:+ start:342 stop:797 length:456 start_codon:yes stop_codon:yes gene_type:complete